MRCWPAILLLSACASTPDRAFSIIDAPEQNRIRISNRSGSNITLYYNYVSSFGDLQMFRMRFRDRSGTLIPITDAPGGWFTPHMRYASLRWPPRRRLTIPAGGSLDFERNIAEAVSWAMWDRPIDGPCEVQLELFGYGRPTGSRSVESLSDWQPAPCPNQPVAGSARHLPFPGERLSRAGR